MSQSMIETEEGTLKEKELKKLNSATENTVADEYCECSKASLQPQICIDIKLLEPKLLKMLSPDGSEMITMETLKEMFKLALGLRFTDDEIVSALTDLGIPKDKPIHVKDFLNQISIPLAQTLSEGDDESRGNYLSTEDWQQAMSRIGVDLTTEQIENILLQCRKKRELDQSLPDKSNAQNSEEPKLEEPSKE